MGTNSFKIMNNQNAEFMECQFFHFPGSETRTTLLSELQNPESGKAYILL